jgi:hypothetical protein
MLAEVNCDWSLALMHSDKNIRAQSAGNPQRAALGDNDHDVTGADGVAELDV